MMNGNYIWKLLLAFFLGVAVGIILAVSFLKVQRVSASVIVDHQECVNVYAPDPVTFELNVAKRGTVMATYMWFEEPEGTWTLKVDIDPQGGESRRNWQGTYPNWWNILLTRPQELPQTIVENVCPSKDKSVTIVEACDGVSVTIYTGDTNRNWRVDGGEPQWGSPYQTLVFGGKYDSVIEWWHNGQWQLADETYVVRTKAEGCEVPVEEPRATTEALAPVCTDLSPVILPQNPHVLRNGSDATVNAFVSQGNKVNVYFKENGQAGWTHALADVPVVNGYVSVTIHDLNPSLGYTFGLQASSGCAGGETVIAGIIDPPAFGVIFPLSFWEMVR